MFVEPVESIGQYGGTWRAGFTGPADFIDNYVELCALLRTPDDFRRLGQEVDRRSLQTLPTSSPTSTSWSSRKPSSRRRAWLLPPEEVRHAARDLWLTVTAAPSSAR